EAFEKARDLREQLQRRAPSPDVALELAGSYRVVGRWHRTHGKRAEALTLLEKGLDLLGPVVEANPAVTDYQEGLALLHKEVGYVHRFNGNKSDAIASMERARKIQEKLAGLYAPGSPFLSELAHTWFEL